ncbi:MAG: hypothetical protein AAFY02_14215 [Pseudomonadota bacterium]
MARRNNGGPGPKPDYIAYSVRDTRDRKGFWRAVGAAWQHRDGEGFDIDLDATPVNGRIVLRELREEREQELSDERSERTDDRDPDQSRDYGPER